MHYGLEESLAGTFFEDEVTNVVTANGVRYRTILNHIFSFYKNNDLGLAVSTRYSYMSDSKCNFSWSLIGVTLTGHSSLAI